MFVFLWLSFSVYSSAVTPPSGEDHRPDHVKGRFTTSDAGSPAPETKSRQREEFLGAAGENPAPWLGITAVQRSFEEEQVVPGRRRHCCIIISKVPLNPAALSTRTSSAG